jgi:hypothetical protein
MSRKAIRSLHGRLDYDPWRLFPDRGELSLTGQRIPSCVVRLHLVDLPIGAIVLVRCRWVLRSSGSPSSRLVTAWRVPTWRTEYTQIVQLEAMGRLEIQILTGPGLRQIHRASYWIDPRRQRPIRDQRPDQLRALDLLVAETVLTGNPQQQKEARGQRTRKRCPPPVPWPAGALWPPEPGG